MKTLQKKYVPFTFFPALPAGRRLPFALHHGFTLIELLVVISIIAILTGLALPNYMGVRQRARDAKRKAELLDLKASLRLYYNDTQGYPTDSGSGGIVGCGGPPLVTCTTTFASGSVTYMKKLPSEYFYERDTTTDEDYRLAVTLENKSDKDIESSQSRCPPLGGTWTPTQYVVCAD